MQPQYVSAPACVAVRRTVPWPLRRLGLTDDDLELIQANPLFSGIDEHFLARLLAGAAVRIADRRTRLFAQGDEASRLYVVLQGWVRLFREAADGRDSTIALLSRGESVAELAVLDGGRHLVSACAASEARLLHIPAAGFAAHLRARPDLCLNLMTALSAQMGRLVRQVEQLTHRSSVQRVAAFLIEFCPSGGGRAEIELPLDKSQIAAWLGMQPETFSRQLAKLRRVGVETAGNRIAVEDVPRLRRYCGVVD